MTSPSSSGLDQVGGVAGGAGLDAGADVRRLGPHQRHGLALHVGAHEGAVGVVVLEERDERGGHRDDLLRRHVHEVDLVRRHVADVGGGAEEALRLEHALEVVEAGGLRRPAHEHALVLERAVGVDRRVRLGDDVLLFLVGRHVDDLVGDPAVDDLAVRRLDEAELVHPGVGRQGADEADVRAFRASRSGTCGRSGEKWTSRTSKPARSRDRPPGPSADRRRRWVRPDSGFTWSMNCDSWEVPKNSLIAATTGRMLMSVCGRDRLDVLGRHALAHDALHAGQADADLVLDQLADRADAAVGEVVLVVEAVARLLLDQVEHVADGGQHLAAAAARPGRRSGRSSWSPVSAEQLAEAGDLAAELAVQLVAADPAEVVAAVLEEGVAEVGAGRLDRGRLARAGPLVDLDQRLVLGRGEVAVLLPLALEEVEVRRRSGRGSRARAPRRSRGRAAA